MQLEQLPRGAREFSDTLLLDQQAVSPERNTRVIRHVTSASGRADFQIEEMNMSTPNPNPLGTSKGKAAEMGQKVTDTIDENRGVAASGLESAAGALRERADTLPGGERVANAAHATANAVGVAADYVRDTDVKAMVADVQTLVKNNPGVALLTAAALGFLIARTFSRD
jgi:ElaB/YqjD/DUF883 family membrane-anchored ribosome-binding protein